jgi:hypothetical protein
VTNVKSNVIRIVQGLPPEEPKTVVSIAPDEFVAKAAEWVQVGAGTGVGDPVNNGTETEPIQEPRFLPGQIAKMYQTGEPGIVKKPKIRFKMLGSCFITPREYVAAYARFSPQVTR